MFKKFIAYILTVSVLLSMVVVNVNAADEEISAERVERFENAITLLTKIGAISEEDTYDFDTGISKAKFLDILSKVVPVSDGSLVPAFQDVPSSHEYFKVVQGFADLGYISGNGGSFEPDRDITYNEALYIALNAMGYKDFMAIVGAYPTGGWYIADQLDIKMKNKGAVAGDIFYMLYQALTTEMLSISGMEKDAFKFSNEGSETLLEKYLEIKASEGVLQSNGKVSLVGGENPSDDTIVVDGISYKTEEPCDILAGCTVDVFYDMETNELVCVLAGAENKIVEIASADLEGFMNNKYTYKVDGSKKTVKIQDETDIVKNNVLVSEIPDDLFMEPERDGKVILVDNGKGTGYDVVYIKDYYSFVAKSVEKDITTVTIKAETASGIPNVVANLENDVPAVYDAEGNGIAIEDIAIGTLVSVMGNVVDGVLVAEEIVVSKNIVTGALTGIYKGDPSYLVIDDVKYPVSASAEYFIDTISPQIDMTFFVDFLGNIVALDNTVSGSMAYGYMLDAYMGTNEDGDPCIIAKIFSEIGSVIKYKVSNKRLTIDGVTSVKNYPDPVRDEYLRQFIASAERNDLVRYDVNNDRELNKIDFPRAINDTNGPNPTVDDRLYRSLNNINGTDYTITQFYGSKKAFGDKVHVDEDTIIFKLPDLSGFEAEADESEYKIIRSIGGLKDGRYGVTSYKLGTDMMYAKVVVVRELLDPSLSIDHIGNMIVKKISRLLNEYGEETYSITLLGMNGEKTYLTKSAAVALNPVDLKNATKTNRPIVPGDIVRCYLTEDETAIAKIAICYDIRNDNITDTSSSTTNWVSDNGTFGSGYVYAMDDKRISIASGATPTSNVILEDNEFSTYMIGSYKIFKVITTNIDGERVAREIVPADASDLKSFKINGGDCSRVVAISSRGTGQLLFVFE